MSAAWIIMVTLGGAGVLALLWLGWAWLAKSWEVIEDDELADRLSRQAPSGWWLRMRWWFAGSQPRLTYRRDKRGRFRKIWRE